jgi:hypothetical protein
MDYMCPHCKKWLHHPDAKDVRDTKNAVAVAADCPECRKTYELTVTTYGYYQTRRPDQVNSDHPDGWDATKLKRPHWAPNAEVGESA